MSAACILFWRYLKSGLFVIWKISCYSHLLSGSVWLPVAASLVRSWSQIELNKYDLVFRGHVMHWVKCSLLNLRNKMLYKTWIWILFDVEQTFSKCQQMLHVQETSLRPKNHRKKNPIVHSDRILITIQNQSPCVKSLDRDGSHLQEHQHCWNQVSNG